MSKKRKFSDFCENNLENSTALGFNDAENEIVPLVFSEKLAQALGMKSVISPPPFFNKLVEMGVPYYFKSNERIIL